MNNGSRLFFFMFFTCFLRVIDLSSDDEDLFRIICIYFFCLLFSLF